MKLIDILNLDSNKEFLFVHDYVQEYKRCHFQYRKKDIPVEILVLHEHIEEFNHEKIEYDNKVNFDLFDKKIDVYYEKYLKVIHTYSYTSSTFLHLIQEKIKEFKKINNDGNFYDFTEWLDIDGLISVDEFMNKLCNAIGCTDLNFHSEKDDERE